MSEKKNSAFEISVPVKGLISTSMVLGCRVAVERARVMSGGIPDFALLDEVVRHLLGRQFGPDEQG